MRMFWNDHTEAEKKDDPHCMISAVVRSDIGHVREKNEDNYLLCRSIKPVFDKTGSCSVKEGDKLIAGVFDGMGGGEAGELASLYAAQAVFKAVSGLWNDVENHEIDNVIISAFQSANNDVILLRDRFRVLGTTGTVFFCRNGLFNLYHLGDSRAYLFRNGALAQLTHDQTLAQLKTDLGLYDSDTSPEEIEKHQLTAYIGQDVTFENLHPTVNGWRALIPDDLLLLCTDGLYNSCSNDEITGILYKNKSLDETADKLVSIAKERGGTDNCTTVIIQYKLEN